jgi:hypothetical protein
MLAYLTSAGIPWESQNLKQQSVTCSTILKTSDGLRQVFLWFTNILYQFSYSASNTINICSLLSCGQNMAGVAGSKRLSVLMVCLLPCWCVSLPESSSFLCLYSLRICRQVLWNAYSIPAFSSMIPYAWACSNELSPNGQSSSTIRYKNTWYG